MDPYASIIGTSINAGVGLISNLTYLGMGGLKTQEKIAAFEAQKAFAQAQAQVAIAEASAVPGWVWPAAIGVLAYYVLKR
jgi:hypothetical protein